MAVLSEYLWMVVVGFIFGFAYAFGIGANDVANAFGTVVAAKSLTLKQAVMVAAVFEFLGSLLLGASVTNTIRSKIFDPNLYEDEPEIVLLGMFSAIITGTFMLLVATWFALPVSTTHTIVGSIMGFSIVAKGFSSINWTVVTQIFISWIASPGITGILAFIFFYLIRTFVLRTEHAFNRAYYTFPIILTLCVFINVFYVLYKGMNNFGFTDEIPLYIVIPAGFGAGMLVGVIWLVAWGPWAKARILKHVAEDDAKASKALEQQWEEIDVDGDGKVQKIDYTENFDESSNEQVIKEDKVDIEAAADAPQGFFKKSMKKFADNTYNQDLHAQSMHESRRAEEIWDDAEKFDPHAEQLFSYVQVFTACMDSFAHGANDVANAIAPISAILLIYETGDVASKAPVQKWILAYGGIGIVMGLLIFGYRVIKSIGYKLAVMSPSRGATAELASSLFVVTASFLAIPVSTTQSQVGAVAGIGLVGGWKSVQWLFLLRVCLSWVVVFFCAALLSAAVFAMFAYTPSLAE